MLKLVEFPLTGISAWKALVDHIGLSMGKKILIHGGAGGIWSIAIQLARHLGAYVATTVSAKDRKGGIIVSMLEQPPSDLCKVDTHEARLS